MVALALCTLGNICSSEMARDLTPDVERIMRNGPAYLKKKATLCASRIIRKEPELIENFLPIVSSLLNDKHHGVMLSGVALVTEMCSMSPGRVKYHKKGQKWTMDRDFTVKINVIQRT